jgi:hypothetical protein
MRHYLAVVAAAAAITSGVAFNGVQAAPLLKARPQVPATTCTAGTWTQMPADVTPTMTNGTLYADTIVSSTDAWAVGHYSLSNNSIGSLWEHWSGGVGWQVVTKGGAGLDLEAVTNFGADNVWAVGALQKGPKFTATISRWNGTTVVRSKIPKKPNSDLFAISGTSESDIWAMGSYESAGKDHILLYHYNGTQWSLATTPTGILFPDGILALSPTNVYMLVLIESTLKTDLYHYNGSSWSIAQTNVPVGGDLQDGLVGTSATDLFAVDATANVVDHWNGAAWSHVGATNIRDQLDAVAEGPTGTVWSDGWNTSTGTNVYVAENGVRETNPAGVTTQLGLMSGIASGSGLVIAVGGQDDDGGGSPSEPIVLMTCS